MARRPGARDARGLARFGIAALLVVVPLGLVPGLLGQPLVSYAQSGSMEPALRMGDGFLVLPLGAPAVGDIILYEPVINAGRLAVHRVVGGDARGYETKGDANAVSDQEAGEPLVTLERVRGRVLTLPGGEPLVLPGLGLLFIEGGAAYRQVVLWTGTPLRVLAYTAAAAGALLFLRRAQAPAAAARPRSCRRPWSARLARKLLPRGLLVGHVTLAAVAALGLIVAGTAFLGAKEVPLHVTVLPEAPSNQTRLAAPGGAVPRELEVQGFPLLPTLVVVEPASPGAHVEGASLALPPGGVGRVAVQQVAGPSLGPQEDRVEVWRYPAYLPEEHLLALHRAVPGGPLWLLGATLLAAFMAWRRAFQAPGAPARLLLSPATGRRAP